MPLFQYVALSSDNKKIKGIVDAVYLSEAQRKLTQKNYTPIKISVIKSKVITKGISSKEILQFTRELSKLLGASLPLFDALIALEEKYRSKKIHSIILCLCDKIKSGNSLSASLAEFPAIFDILYRSIVFNAERTGSLANAFNELTEILENQQSVRKKVINTLTYPCILTGFCICVLFSLFFFVIPSLAELFEERDVHFFTRTILGISQWLNEKKFVFFVSMVLSFSLIFLLALTQKFKNIFFRLLFSSPLIGNILQKLAIIRFARSFSALLEGGVSFIYAFRNATNVMKHPFLEKRFNEIEKKVLEGNSFSLELEKISIIPSFMTRMIGIAEKSGNMSFILKQIAEIEEDDLSRNLTHLTSIIQPFILLVLGVIVGLVLLAVLVPLTDVSSFINA